MTHQHHHPAPKNARSRHLVILNAVLLTLLAAVTIAPNAGAQNETRRARGQYTVVGGEITSGNSNAIYVLDAANRELLALRWEEARRQVIGVGYRDLAMDLTAEPQR